MKEQLRNLWKETFADEEDFLDLFFTNVYKEENVLFYEKKGQIISALHMIPYEMTLDNETIPVSYICGVATIPQERGKGHMASLMLQAHETIRKRGDLLAVLIPATPSLFEYYKEMGYENLFYYQESFHATDILHTQTEKYTLFKSNSLPVSDLYNVFDKMQKKRKMCIQHTYNDFKNILQDLRNSEGNLYSLINKYEEITAQAFIVPVENNLLIKDLLYQQISDKEILLSCINRKFHQKKIIVREPVQNGIPVPFGMAYKMHDKINLQREKIYGFMSLMLE